MASMEAIERRRANRRAASAAKILRTSAKLEIVSRPAGSVPAHREPVPLSVTEEERIKRWLHGHACTEAWVETIMEAIRGTNEKGRRVIPYTTSATGTLKTKLPRLLEMIADALIYPPPPDDVGYCSVDHQTHHVGSAMGRCACKDCTEGGRAVTWPRSYLVGGIMSQTCLINQKPIDIDVLWGIGVEQTTDAPNGGRYISAKEVTELKKFDGDAWRRDGINQLGIEDPAVVKILRGHRWSDVATGEVRVRGLANVGAFADFLEFGHRFESIFGLLPAQAADVEQRVMDFPRDGRMVRVRMKWQKLKVSKKGKQK